MNDTRLQNNEEAYRSTFFWIKETNNRLSEINKQLLLLGGISIPLLGVFIGTSNMYLSQVYVLSIGGIVILLSLVFGFLQLYVDLDYFSKSAKYEEKRKNIYAKSSIKDDAVETEIRKLKKHGSSSTHLPIILQIITVFLGLFLILLSIFNTMFQNTRSLSMRYQKHDSMHRVHRWYGT